MCFLVTTGAQKPPVGVSKQPVGGSWYGICYIDPKPNILNTFKHSIFTTITPIGSSSSLQAYEPKPSFTRKSSRKWLLSWCETKGKPPQRKLSRRKHAQLAWQQAAKKHRRPQGTWIAQINRVRCPHFEQGPIPPQAPSPLVAKFVIRPQLCAETADTYVPTIVKVCAGTNLRTSRQKLPEAAFSFT